jgi:diacylglycerol O-acyltransferase
MARKPLSNVDTAWLRMEDPTNLMMITGVIVFGAPMDFERLKATIEVGLLRFDRFRQRVVMPALPGGRLYWEDDPDFDLDYHLQRARLAPPGDQRTLQELASLLASRQLDFSRPLWQFHLVEEYGDGCALICRLHHCIGDGLALVHVLLSLTETEPDTAWPMVEPEAPRRRRRRRMGRLCRPAASALRTTGHVTRSLIREGWGTAAHPSRLVNGARIGFRGTKSLARLLLLLPDARTAFKGPLGVPKRVAWSAPIPLQDVKAVGKGLGGTVNDLLLAATSGALRRYLENRGEPVDGLNFRAVVPVNLRKPGTEHELGNKFGLVFLSLPVGIIDPIERLNELKRRMDALKDSLEAPVAFGILTTIGMAPEVIQDVVVNIFGLKGTAVMTNVIGPKEQIYLAGAPLESLMFWVPQSGHLGMGVSIMSYNSQVRVGVITDAGLVPDPEAIVAGFDAEFDELLQVAQEAERARRAEEAPGLGDVVDRLGETLAALDKVLEDQRREPEAAPSETPERCQALTKAGKPCKNRPLSGSRYCWIHQET